MASTRQERAKQFIPFDALKGLQEAYRKKEIEIEERKNLSEESKYELDEVFHKINIGDTIKLRYYNKTNYINETKKLKKIDKKNKLLIFENDVKIKISDIISIEKIM